MCSLQFFSKELYLKKVRSTFLKKTLFVNSVLGSCTFFHWLLAPANSEKAWITAVGSWLPGAVFGELPLYSLPTPAT